MVEDRNAAVAVRLSSLVHVQIVVVVVENGIEFPYTVAADMLLHRAVAKLPAHSVGRKKNDIDSRYTAAADMLHQAVAKVDVRLVEGDTKAADTALVGVGMMNLDDDSGRKE